MPQKAKQLRQTSVSPLSFQAISQEYFFEFENQWDFTMEDLKAADRVPMNYELTPR